MASTDSDAAPLGIPILLIDDDRWLCALIKHWLAAEGYRVVIAHQGEQTAEIVRREQPRLIYLDLHLPGCSGLETLHALRRADPQVPIVMLSADDTVSAVVDAMRAGAVDYLPKPVTRESLLARTRQVLDGATSRRRAESASDADALEQMTLAGISTSIRQLRHAIADHVDRDDPLLIVGERGTGRRRVARVLHVRSTRNQNPFVEWNAAEKIGGEALGVPVLEEHVALAGGGVLLLSNLDTLKPAALDGVVEEVLAALETARCRMLITVSRITAVPAVLRKAFSTHLSVPPLSERGDDLPTLVADLLSELGERVSLDNARCSPETLELLSGVHFEDNVRGLADVLRRALARTDDGRIQPEHLPMPVRAADRSRDALGSSGESLVELERQAILAAMDHHEGNLSAVSRALGIGRTTLYRKLRKFGVREP